jgi:tRNA(adenine34) deaminase
MVIRDDLFWMRRCLELAGRAALAGEVPVGALVVLDGELVSSAFNRKETLPSPIAHAEVIALHRAALKLGRWRLSEATLYVSLEPCAMCAGALVQSRVTRLVFGAFDPKAGACGSVFSLVSDSRLNHQCEVTSGVLQKECSAFLSDFFKGRRAQNKVARGLTETD